jgi:aromatic-L-amino-acid/L-tryptophan decarboxylase
MTDRLEADRATREELRSLVAGYLDDWIDRIPGMEAYGESLPAETFERLQQPPTEEGRDLEDILADLEEAGGPGIRHPSGGHMSYIPNGGLYTAALAEFLASGLNRYTGVTGAAPGFTAIEHGLIRWMAAMLGLGHGSSGLLLSGGSMANLSAIATARTARLEGEIGEGRIYVSAHTHHSVAKAARLAGFRPDQVVAVDVDTDLRMDAEALAGRVAADRAVGHSPFLVVATAGSTDTGTVDDLAAVATVAEDLGVWLHVDGAYGGFFQLTGRGRRVLAGIERSDSVTLDPHKGLSTPFGVGALLVRDEASLVEAHLGRGAYLEEDDIQQGLRDISSLGPELTRPFRALPVWLPLQLHGVAPFRDALERSLDLAEHAHRRLSGIDGIEVMAPDLSIVAFRFADDDLGRAALEAVNADRVTHLSNTVIDGRFVLRLAILNRRTTVEHVDHAIDIIEKTLAG